MKELSLHRAFAVLLTVALVLSAGCAGNPPPTPVAAVADDATKVEQSANVILHSAQTANATVLPSTGKPVVTRDQLDQVAIAVNKLGRLGLTLRSTLDAYNTAKKAGSDLAAQRLAVSQVVADISASLNIVRVAIPQGTVQAVDNAVMAVLSVIVDVRAQAGLPGGAPKPPLLSSAA